MSRLLRTANGGFVHPDDPGEPGYGDTRQRWSVTPRECRVLSALAVGREVLEIGTGLGISTRAISATAKSVTTIDVDPWVANTIAPALPPNARFYADRDAVPADVRWSMAFIDGLHERRAVAEDTRYALSRLELPGLLVLHDGRMPHVQAGIVDSRVDVTAAFPLTTEAGLVLVCLGAKR